ncbi:hypothetical protein MCHI_002199 [Candidatus Magnetoovum chiemensis]|nr:hypothetical protein MCHI_002199 [Candidatus Magnetoovum chiemensis]
MTTKSIWQSKTFWVNIIAMAAILIQQKTGCAVEMETQTAALALINLGLRLITKQAVSWDGK